MVLENVDKPDKELKTEKAPQQKKTTAEKPAPVKEDARSYKLNHHRLEAGGFDWRLEAA